MAPQRGARHATARRGAPASTSGPSRTVRPDPAADQARGRLAATTIACQSIPRSPAGGAQQVRHRGSDGDAADEDADRQPALAAEPAGQHLHRHRVDGRDAGAVRKRNGRAVARSVATKANPAFASGRDSAPTAMSRVQEDVGGAGAASASAPTAKPSCTATVRLRGRAGRCPIPRRASGATAGR